jgi:hypothetical protein
MKSLLLSLLLIFSSISCELSEKENRAVNELKVDLELNSSIPFNQLINDLELIPLETNDSLVIGDIFKIDTDQDFLYLLDTRFEEVFIFNFEGKGIGKISSTGKGIGEYVRADDFCLGPLNTIFILDTIQKKILQFNRTNWAFIREFRITFDCVKFETLNDSLFVFFRGLPIAGEGDKYQIYITDFDGDIINKHLDYDKGTSACFSPYSPLQKLGTEISIMPIYEQNIYKIDSNLELLPKFRLDLGKYNIDKALLLGSRDYTHSSDWLMLKNLPNMPYYINYYESPTFYHLFFYVNDYYYNVIYKKDANSYISFESLSNNPIGYNGRPIGVTKNGFFLAAMNPGILLTSELFKDDSHQKYPNLAEEQKKLKSLKNLDNQVIVKYKYIKDLF